MLPEAAYTPPDERDREIFEATVSPDHYLRQVKAVIDFERCRDDLVSCYSAHLGRPAKEPVLLLKLEFLQFHYNLSDRRVVEQARANMAFRYFLDLSLHSRLPDHTLLTKFRDRLGAEKHQKVFENIVGQAREYGLVKDRLRLKDATHVLANIAIPSTIRLVAEVRCRLLEGVRPYAPERVAQEEAHAACVRASTADLSGEESLLQRVTHLRAIVTWVEVLEAELGAAGAGDPQRQTLQEALTLAHKVLADREQPKAKDKLVSLEDRDARWGKHGKVYAGYLLDVAADADSEIITAVNVLPANGDEAADATTLIRQEEQAHGNDVEGLSIDGIGFRGSLLREWTDPQGLNLEVIVPPKQETATGLYTVEQFTLAENAQSVTCPAGQTSTSSQVEDTGRTYLFPRSRCAACPLQAQCVDPLPAKRGRAVFKSTYEAEYRAARAKAQTPAFAAARGQHWRIERKLGELVQHHGARHARYRGCPRVLVQGLMTAVVVNVKRLVRWLTTLPVRAEPAATG